MKKVLNYSVTYINNEGENKEEFYSNKLGMITRYVNMLSGKFNVSLLSAKVNYVNCGTEDITQKINKFVM